MLYLDMDKLLETIRDKWGNSPCPMCGNNTWTVSNDIVTFMDVSIEGGIVLGNGKILPIIPVSCNNCSNTILINPKSLGCLTEINEANS